MPDTVHFPVELAKWEVRARENQFAHYESSNYYSRLHYWLGIPTVILSAIVGTTVFASLNDSTDIKAKYIVAAISILVAILTGIQTFLKFSERAEQHKFTAAKFGSIRREIEQRNMIGDKSPEDFALWVDELRKRLNDLSDNAPSISPNLWKKAQEKMKMH